MIREEPRNTDNISSVPITATRVSHYALTNTVDVFNDDDFFCDIDVDLHTASTENSNHTTAKIFRNDIVTPSRSVILFDDDMDDEDFLKIEDVAPQQNTHNSALNDKLLLFDTSSQNLSHNVSISDDNYPFRIRGVNLVTLKQLNECSLNDRLRRKHFLVKAEIDAVQEKVRISRGNNTFKLGVLLKDSPAKQDRLQVRFSSVVLEKMANVSPREIKEMFAKQETHPQVLEDIAEILDKLGAQLTKLNAYLKIEFISSSKVPVVVEIIQSAKFLEQKLAEKLTSENLLD